MIPIFILRAKKPQLILALTTPLLLLLSGCGTFDGMSMGEQEQANKDLAAENHYNPALKPDRSWSDNGKMMPPPR
jgi:hypothetical protein